MDEKKFQAFRELQDKREAWKRKREAVHCTTVTNSKAKLQCDTRQWSWRMWRSTRRNMYTASAQNHHAATSRWRPTSSSASVKTCYGL